MGFIPNEIISAVIERNDIVATIGRYVALKKAGRNFKALCPFHHEKSPSFVVNPDKQIFHCFGCGAGGNVIGFVMRQERLEFPQAVRQLADLCGITIPDDKSFADEPSRQLREGIYRVNQMAADYFHDLLLNSREPSAKTARDYLKNRGINLDAVKTFHLGFAANEWDGLMNFLKKKDISISMMEQAGLIIARESKQGHYDRFRNRIMFPISDIQSRVVAFGARALSSDEGAKYINSPETPVYTKGRHMYGLHLTKSDVGSCDEVLVVEGYMDLIMPFCHGVKNIAASLGTALTPEQIRLIRRYTPHVVMLFDTDPAGQNAIIRSLDTLIDEGMHVRVATLAPGQDPDSYIREHGVEAFILRLKQAMPLFDFKLSWLKNKYDATTIEGKAAISQDMLTTIARYDNEVIKSELVKKLKNDLDIEENAVLKQLNTIPKSQNPRITVHQNPDVPLSLKDQMFLGVLLSDAQYAQKAKDMIVPEDILHPLLQGIVQEIWKLSEIKQNWMVSDLLVQLPDPKMQDVVTAIASKSEAWLGAKDQVFNDCVTHMLKKRLSRDIKDVKKAGDVGKLDELIKKMKN